jgi:hypothetical protein
MKDLTEAQLIEMERHSRRLIDILDVDTDELSRVAASERLDRAFYAAEAVAQDVAELCEHLRAVSIEAQKMENLAAKDAA